MQKCEKCGEKFNKEDFSKLKFKQEFIGHFTDELDPFNELTICPECFNSEEKIEDTFSNKAEYETKNSINYKKHKSNISNKK